VSTEHDRRELLAAHDALAAALARPRRMDAAWAARRDAAQAAYH
jgi:hypothetical protein